MSYHMPAEFQPHFGCILHYPHLSAVWRGVDGDCRYGKKAFRNVARAIAQEGHEEVHMFCTSDQAASELNADLKEEGGDVSNIHVHVAKSDDSWIRDTGPTFTFKNSASLVGIDWNFNAYGGYPPDGCYSPWENDKVLAIVITEILSTYYKPQVEMSCLSRMDIVLEGGSIHTDGEGTLLTTEQCLLHGKRNPNFSKEDYEVILKQQLGVSKVIWLKEGLYMDLDTNGHIDNIACFIKPGHVALAWSDDVNDEQYRISRECEQTLLNTTDAKGRTFVIHKLHCPQPPLYYTQEEVDTMTPSPGYTVLPRTVGERMAATYANFYIANDAIVVPGFDNPEYDQKAKDVLQELFPEKKVVQVYSREIILGGGNVHCITQQIPKVLSIQ